VRPPPVPLRRAVLDPAWPLLAAALGVIFLAVALAGVLAWPLDRRIRVTRLALLAALYLGLNAALLTGCGVLFLRHPVAARRDRDRWESAHTLLLGRALGTLRSAAGPLLGFAVTLEEPPDIARLSAGPLLALARHAGPGDSFTLVELLISHYGRQPRIVLKETLQWDPGLDVVLNRLSACFLPARAAAGQDLPGELARLARGLHGRDAMLIFPEGRNWTPVRYRRAVARLRRRALPQAVADAISNPHVLPPRPAGVQAVLAARPDLDVVVVAHTGLEDLVSASLLWDALPLRARPMRVRWWFEPAATIPGDADGRYQWLRLHWAIVDSWIGARKAGRDEPVAAGLGIPPAGSEPGDAGQEDTEPEAGPLVDTPG
jgi:1-acyl-sn-glycerol-3-phosphate acyltransferase